MKILKTLFFSYQKSMWYVAQASGEYSKLGRFNNEILLLLTFLSVRGVQVPFWSIPFGIVGFLCIFNLAGYLLVKFGVTEYNNRLANKQNTEFMELCDRMKRIEELLIKQNGTTGNS